MPQKFAAFCSSLPQKLIAYWSSLPAWLKITLKACAAAFVGGASTIAHHAYIADRGCITEHCILEYVAAGIHGGVLAVGFYLLHSPFAQKIEATLPALNTQSFAAAPIYSTGVVNLNTPPLAKQQQLPPESK